MASGFEDGPKGDWPGWAKLGVSSLVLFHGTAVVVAVLAAAPSSELEKSIAGQFRWYYQLVDQGYSYRYYTAGASPTPIVTAELEFEDGRAEGRRIPDRSLRPRLRFQRHLALAYHLFQDVRRAGPDPHTGENRSRWARSYARHLCRSNPGCLRVTLFVQDHRNPDPLELVAAARRGEAVDVEAPRFYGDRTRIGAYSCDD